MNEKKYDIAIIGSGPGGYTAAIRARQLSFDVALIEKNLVGGICLNEGCIPTKALLTSADMLDNVKKASSFGIDIQNVSFDLKKMVQRKDNLVKNLNSSLKNLILSNKIDLIEGEASFIDTNTLLVADKKIKAKNIIIATGSINKTIPNLLVDNEYIYDSSSIINLKNLPKSIAIIGGGYIGCEFASFFARLNVKVFIIEAQDKILSFYDKNLSDILEKSFKKDSIEIKTKSTIKDIKKSNNKVVIRFDTNEEIEVEKILVAIGRTPNTKNLNLEKINLAIGSKKEIIIDDKMKTNISNIYAIGDVTAKSMLAHVASHQAIIAVGNIANIENKMEYKAIPSVIFTKPEIASVGLNEEMAKEKKIDIEIGKFPFSALGKSHALNEKDGFVEVIFDKKTKKLLGAKSVGLNSSILIAEMALAITNNLTADDIIKTIHTHPTLPEAWIEATFISQNRALNFPPNLRI